MIINIIKLTSLLVFTGLPVFYLLVVRYVDATVPMVEMSRRQINRLTILAALVYFLISLVSDIYVYFDIDALVPTLENLNLILAPAFVFLFLKSGSHHQTRLNLFILAPVFAILLIHASTSHVAGQLGLLPYGSNFLHLITAAFWSGGLIGLAYLFYIDMRLHAQIYVTELARMALRFSRLTIISLLIMLVSGAILMVSNVHSIDALNTTPYGSSLKIKLLLVLLLVFLLSYELLKISPRMGKLLGEATEGKDIQFARTRRLILFMSMTILPVILTTGILSSYPPPNTAPFLKPQTLTFNVEQYPVRVEVQPLAGSSSNVRFELFVPDILMQQPATLVNYSLYMPQSKIGVREIEAIQVTQNSFQGEASFPMPGIWRLDLQLYPGLGNQLNGGFTFELLSLPLAEDLRTYFSYSSIVYSPANKITFLVGTLLLVIYGWLTWYSQSGKAPVWISIAGLMGVSIGIYLVMSVMLVKTYPSTYWKNPQTYSALSVGQGQSAYMGYCADCHGQTGIGDGSWAVENRGFIPSLSSPHLDVHTDGEIYWWITYGIPSLDMPPLGERLSVETRWDIINYVRSLRHGYPQ